MKVKMLVAVSGTRDGEAWPARGETADLPDAEAADLCAAGLAEPVAEKPEARTEKRTAKKSTSSRG